MRKVSVFLKKVESSMIVYKIELKDCPRCLLMKGYDEEIFGVHVTEVDFDTLKRSSHVYSLLESISEKNHLTSLSFPFYIFDGGSEEVHYLSGVKSPNDLKTRFEELTQSK